MAAETAVGLSILISTRNRAACLPALFESLQAALAATPVRVETIVIDNGSTDDTGAVIDAWVPGLPDLIHLSEARPGKSRALNRGLQVARAPLLAFVDDDVRVAADWIAAVLAFFVDYPQYDAASGRVWLDRSVTDADALARLALYRTLPLYDGGDALREDHGLTGSNMVLRRRVFDVIGGFNERLGPGASGAHEDADLVARARAAGLRVGYMPTAIVYHALDPERLTPAFFREFQRRMARSWYALDPRHTWRKSAGRLPEIVAGFAWWSLCGNPSRRTRAWGRLILHTEVLRLRWRDGRHPPPPLVAWHGAPPARRRKSPATRDA